MSDVKETSEKVIYVERQKEPTGFALERKIPLAVVLAVFGNLVAGIWFAAHSSFTLSEHARRLSAVEVRSDEHAKQLNSLILDVTQRLVRIEARLQVQQQTQAQRERE